MAGGILYSPVIAKLTCHSIFSPVLRAGCTDLMQRHACDQFNKYYQVQDNYCAIIYSNRESYIYHARLTLGIV